jgi:hypothetical protein
MLRRWGFDHVGFRHQLDLPAVLPRHPVRDAQAISRGVGVVDNRQPKAAPYLAAALVIAAAVWTVMGSPHSPKPVTQQLARSYVLP